MLKYNLLIQLNCKPASKTKYNVNNFDQEKNMISENINLKIEKLKTKIKLSFTTPILSDLDVLAYLGKCHWKYIILPIDKTSNNFAFISKMFFISKILSEVGEYINIQFNSTFQKQTFLKVILLKIMKTIVKNLILNWHTKTVLYL